jgi:hypothetical protein
MARICDWCHKEIPQGETKVHRYLAKFKRDSEGYDRFEHNEIVAGVFCNDNACIKDWLKAKEAKN